LKTNRQVERESQIDVVIRHAASTQKPTTLGAVQNAFGE